MAGEDPAGPWGRAVTLHQLGERGLIERVRQRLGPPPADVLLGIGDDSAAVAWPGGTLLLTTDTLVEDVHFRRKTTGLRDLGAKALAVNLSDIAAMGGEPRFALLALALPPSMPLADLDDLCAGLADMAGRHAVAVIGGDTCADPDRIVLTLTLVGRVEGAPVARSGARAGDAILVTGSLGAAAAGLAVLERGAAMAPPIPDALSAPLLAAHRVPTPRVAEGRAARAAGAAAMIDLSDGLATDLGHIAAQSGVGAEVRLAALPVTEPTRRVAELLGEPAWGWAVSGGEDYELCLTARPEAAAALARRVTAETGTPVTVIGEVRPAADGVRFLDERGRPVEVRAGFEHFR
jgi:thiamine-monophosphate kinase